MVAKHRIHYNIYNLGTNNCENMVYKLKINVNIDKVIVVMMVKVIILIWLIN